MGNVYRHELKVNLKVAIIWTAVIVGLMAVIMAFFPTIRDDMESFQELMKNYPQWMQEAFGLDSNNLGEPIGFYSFSFLYTTLFAAIAAMNLGLGIVSKEQREQTADFLMTKPVSRGGVFFSKVLASITILLAISIVYNYASFVVIGAFTNLQDVMTDLILINVSLFCLQIIFFAIGLLVSVAVKKIKSVLPVSLGIVFVLYSMSSFMVGDSEDVIRYFTPFQYFKTEYILEEGHYELSFFITGLVVIAVCITSAYWIYKNKDVHAV